jgi:hypothetical protein
MPKDIYKGMQFRLNFIAENGQLLISTEWTADRDRIIHLADRINHTKGVRIRALPETKGSGFASAADEEGRLRLVK